MATKDYVKRGRAAKKPARKTPSRGSQPSGQFPVKWALIALCLVTALGYGLYFLSSSPQPAVSDTTPARQTPVKDKTPPAPAAKPKQETSTKVDTKPVTAPKPQEKLPPKPAEKWRYIEELENKEVQVEAKKVPEKPGRPYLMQCGAYRSPAQAEERKAMIAFQGLTSQIKVSQGEKGSWYRVVLGPYPQKRKAESDRNMLRRAGIEPCAIWYWDA
ncbi:MULTISPECIES: SPOR domain-containing protein [Photobacterium]|uniref:Cell division protein n=1 Tax=Photobacterium halotolerans TaxID=265726 RepID=A0A0F5VEG8_9GAMM|nr:MULTISPECIES: SPOR domain-containing protein [Photobacterium]KKD00187.1 cell division protein [Photobacterium halotolerans]UIP28154.1 SPOR domain-containing protein [Photobacterium sp. TLY01]